MFFSSFKLAEWIYFRFELSMLSTLTELIFQINVGSYLVQIFYKGHYGLNYFRVTPQWRLRSVIKGEVKSV